MAGLKLRLTILSAVAAFAILLLCVPQIYFNWGYHNDEPTKVTQILDGVWNLRHPPLMLGVVSLLGKLTGQQDPQRIVEYGRWVSVLSIGALLLACLGIASLRAGAAAGLAAGLLLLFHPYVFEVAHYFKEDSMFLAAEMGVLLLLFYCERTPGHRAEIFLAVILALAVSAKYIGWGLLPLVLLFVTLNRKKYAGRWCWFWGWPLAAFVVLALLINLPLVANWHGFRESLGDEMYRLEKGDYGMHSSGSMGRRYVFLVLQQMPPVLVFGYLFYVLYRLCRWRSTAVAEWIFLGTPLLTLALLALTAKYSERYILPVLVPATVAAVYGPLLVLGEWLRGRTCFAQASKIIAAVLLVGSGWWLWGEWYKIYDGFRHDSRMELTEWICRNLPEDALIAQDTYAKINPYDLQQRVLIDNFFVADIGSLDELRRMGVTQVIISYDVYHRFVDGSVNPPKNQLQDFERRRLFYETARRKLKILWQDDNANPKALHPGLMLIQL
jgi:hypothetical protein